MSIRSVAALWELYDGKTYVGYVEKPHVGAHPWIAVAVDVDDELGRYRTRQAAEAALRKHRKDLVAEGRA